jgi:micrococcal nuclease
VTLAFSGRRADRYGRTLAHVFVEPTAEDVAKDPAAERVWIQAHLLSRGHARAYVLKENLGCLREMTGHEAVARAAGIGLWSHAAYQARDATRTHDLMQLRSTFQIVEGEVTGVVQTRTALVLRFGRETATGRERPTATGEATMGPRGFSLAIKPAIVRAWALNGLTLEALEGRRLRIHGWIERRGGPVIEILDAHQIEFVDDGPHATNAMAADDQMPQPRRRSRKASREAGTGQPMPQ